MEYEHFFRPIGFAFDVVAQFRPRVERERNENVQPAPQNAPTTEAIVVNENIRADREAHRNILRFLWYLNYVPLPVVNYRALWQRYGTTDIRQLLWSASKLTSKVVSQLFRLLIYVTSLAVWIRFIVSSVASCGNMVTYSQTFFSDIFTYSIRNYPSLVDRRYELYIASYNDDISVVNFDSIGSLLFDIAASRILVSCVGGKEATKCELVRSSLIFKLSDILVKCYSIWDYLPSVVLTGTTIIIYVLFAIGAQVLNINVVALVTFVAYKRQLPLIKFFIDLIKSIWLGSVTYVI